MRSPDAPEAAIALARRPGVLVADDESEIRSVLEDGLQREGFSVWMAADGQEALELFRQHSDAIDMALLDVLMPRLDGPRTLAALQALRPHLPCCFMTGFLGAYSEAELHTQGARAVLKKPFMVPKVAQVLRAVWAGPAPAPVPTLDGAGHVSSDPPVVDLAGRIGNVCEMSLPSRATPPRKGS